VQVVQVIRERFEAAEELAIAETVTSFPVLQKGKDKDLQRLLGRG
jgi:hypothetical protein